MRRIVLIVPDIKETLYPLWSSRAASVAEEVLADHDERVARPRSSGDGEDPLLRHGPVPLEPHGAGVASAPLPSQAEVVAAPGGRFGFGFFCACYAVQQDLTPEMHDLSSFIETRAVSLPVFLGLTQLYYGWKTF